MGTGISIWDMHLQTRVRHQLFYCGGVGYYHECYYHWCLASSQSSAYYFIDQQSVHVDWPSKSEAGGGDPRVNGGA